MNTAKNSEEITFARIFRGPNALIKVNVLKALVQPFRDYNFMPCDTHQDIKAIIIMGVCGSGKSTVGAELAERLGFVFEDGDDFHPQSNIERMRAGIPLDDTDRLPWLKAIAHEIDVQISAGHPLVIACSALKRTYRELLLADHRVNMRIVYLDAAREVLEARMINRNQHFMPAPLLDSQVKTLEEPEQDEDAIHIDANGTVDQTVSSILKALKV